MKRLVTLGATVALFAAPAAGIATGSASASAKSVRIAVHAGTARVAGTVNVANLPRLTPTRRSPVRVPLHRAPGSSFRSASVSGAEAPGAPSPQLTITPGTPLTGALGDQDNINLNGFELTPPDMGFAVGPGTTHKEIEMINLVGKIWTGSTPGAAFALNPFFSPSALGDSLSDPWVLYDGVSGRFFAGIFDITLGGEIMAVSQTSNPGGVWTLYRVRYPSTTVTNGGCPDQGKGGVDSNVVALGFNEFSAAQCAGGGGSFLGAAIEVFNKSQMTSGTTVNFVYTDPQSTWFSMVPAHSLGSGVTTERFASLSSGTGTALHQVTSVGVPPSTVTLTQLSDITVPQYSNPPKAVQKGTTVKIDSGDDRTQHVVWKMNWLLLSATVGCIPSGDTLTRACGRLYEVNTSTSPGTLKKTATIAANGVYYFYPSATIMGSDVVVSIGASSSSFFGRLYATAGPWAGSLNAPVLVQGGTASNTTGRYGDYNAVALQPGSSTVFWVAGEVGGTSGSSFKWNTAAGSLTVGP